MNWNLSLHDVLKRGFPRAGSRVLAWTAVPVVKLFLILGLLGAAGCAGGGGTPTAGTGAVSEVERVAGAMGYRPEDLGLITQGVYVVVNSPRNVVLLPGGRRWTGRLRGTRDVMLIRQGEIMSATGVPESIRQTCDAQINFEQDRIAYFFFRERTGGHFVRR